MPLDGGERRAAVGVSSAPPPAASWRSRRAVRTIAIRSRAAESVSWVSAVSLVID